MMKGTGVPGSFRKRHRGAAEAGEGHVYTEADRAQVAARDTRPGSAAELP